MANIKISKFIVIVFITAVIIGIAGLRYINKNEISVSVVPTQSWKPPVTTGKGDIVDVPKNNNQATTTTPSQPSVLNLQIPFTSQAPTGNWDELHNEACEEASSIMAAEFLNGNKTAQLPSSYVEEKISALTMWQDNNFGYHLDTTAAETAKMIEGYYGLKTKIYNNYTFDDVKKELAQGHVVIMPVNGRLIGNPNYKQPGPIYHMLVIRGYSSAGLITNDSGTRKGQNYPYAFDTLHNAGADWNHTTNTIDANKTIIIVVSK